MSDFSLPAYDQLGPDPEPIGARADRLIEAAAVVSLPSAALTDLLPGASLTGLRT